MAGRTKKITLKNATGKAGKHGGGVTFKVDGNIKKLAFPDATTQVTMEQLHTIYNDRGGRVMLEEDILRVMDTDARETLGLEPLDEYMIDGDGYIELLKNGSNKMIADEGISVSALEDFLKYCSDAALERLIAEAIKLKIGDIRTLNLIKTYTGQNLAPIIEEEIDNEKKGDAPATIKTTEAGTKKRGRKPKVEATIE